MHIGSRTFVPILVVCKKETAVSHSSTETGIKPLDAGLRIEGTPAMNLWEKVIETLHPKAGRDSMRTMR